MHIILLSEEIDTTHFTDNAVNNAIPKRKKKTFIYNLSSKCNKMKKLNFSSDIIVTTWAWKIDKWDTILIPFITFLLLQFPHR